MRVRLTVRKNFSGELINPGATTFMITGERRIPKTATTARIMERSHMADLASLKASSLPLTVKYSVNTGINAMLREPSAKSLLSRFGILNATKKASALSPAPKNHAMTTSLIKPNTRLNKVAAPTTPAAFVTRVFSDIDCF